MRLLTHAFTNQWYMFSLVEANLNKNAELVLRWCLFYWGIFSYRTEGAAILMSFQWPKDFSLKLRAFSQWFQNTDFALAFIINTSNLSHSDKRSRKQYDKGSSTADNAHQGAIVWAALSFLYSCVKQWSNDGIKELLSENYPIFNSRSASFRTSLQQCVQIQL